LTNLGKYLVGRVIFFDLLPFSFHEFLRAKGEKYEKRHNEIRISLDKSDSKIHLKKTVFIDELNSLLHEYITYGAYPRIVLEKDKSKKKELLKNLFTTYIEKDIVSLYGIKYRDGAVKLLRALSSMMGGVIKYETLSETTGLKYNEVKELLALLQDSFVISIVPPFYKNLASEIRKNPKIYFVDYGIRNLLIENFAGHNFEFLYENFVHNELKRHHTIKYWRTTTKSEVDFIIDDLLIPVEVKSGDKATRALVSFMETYGSKFGIIANLKVAEERERKIYMIPFVYLG
jgi:predicted AAA+ superfamily ATPase